MMMKAWISAMRLRTLPLALSCVLTGSAFALSEGKFSTLIFVLTVITTVLLQVLSNFANDLGDSENGADNEGRIGPTRAVQSGMISKQSMKRAVISLATLSLIAGVTLLWFALKDHHDCYSILWMFFLGITAIAAAIRYTAGKNPYGYLGLGDLFVFLFFGVVGVCGTAFLQTGELNLYYLLPSTAIGLLSTAVLNLNNMRDIHNDEAVGKRTIPVRIGAKNALTYHYILIISGVLCGIWSARFIGTETGVASIALIIPIIHLLKIRTFKSPQQFDPELKKIALSTFLYSLLLFISTIFF